MPAASAVGAGQDHAADGSQRPANARRATMGRVTTWRPEWTAFPPDLLDFWTERHLCTLTTLRADGRPHVVPVGVALDPEERCAWVITSRASRQGPPPRLPRPRGRLPGRRAPLVDDRGHRAGARRRRAVARAEERYAARYRTPRENPDRIAIRIEVDRILSSRTV